MGNSFVKGAIIITIATFVSKLLGSAFRIPLQNIAGDEVFGLFNAVYPVYMIALILSVAGIPIAISKLISEQRAKNDEQAIHEIFASASIIGLIFGFVSFLFMFIFSEVIATAIGMSSTRLAVAVVSSTLILAPYMAVYRGFFQGYEDMRPTAVSQVLEQFVRVTLVLVIAYILVLQNHESEIIAGWIMLSSIAGVTVSLIYLRFKYSRFIKSVPAYQKLTWDKFRSWSSVILRLSLPVAFGALNMALLNMIDSLTIPHALKWYGYEGSAVTEQFSIYSRGLTLVQIAVVFSSAVILPLIPKISKATTENNWNEANNYIGRSLKLAHLISWPAAVGLLALTLPLNLALFTDLEGSHVLAVLHFSSLFTSFTVLTTGILQGLNRANVAAIIILMSAVLKAILNLWLIPSYDLIGAAWATLIVYIVITVLNVIFILTVTKYPLNNYGKLIMMVSSVIMGVCLVLPLKWINIEEWTRIDAVIYTLIAVPIGGIVYSIIVLGGKGLQTDELRGIPVLGPILCKILKLR
ncbi:putative polysaccharide biosynthesis protein [Bacillus solimangrovi]|uniref:Polysaccharide biosynthesis/transport protein n=1 Tax=Bacillus solimangrovi TaxID=1305675 RepID=A0A1E5LDQ3_9BACI|nr:polysaccharide biosynthesis protein [Bacillus solimangrovi]OEH92180.1 polysaccharide biosynthesis/transport protein [Bacillus solimangrovi]